MRPSAARSDGDGGTAVAAAAARDRRPTRPPRPPRSPPPPPPHVGARRRRPRRAAGLKRVGVGLLQRHEHLSRSSRRARGLSAAAASAARRAPPSSRARSLAPAVADRLRSHESTSLATYGYLKRRSSVSSSAGHLGDVDDQLRDRLGLPPEELEQLRVVRLALLERAGRPSRPSGRERAKPGRGVEDPVDRGGLRVAHRPEHGAAFDPRRARNYGSRGGGGRSKG